MRLSTENFLQYFPFKKRGMSSCPIYLSNFVDQLLRNQTHQQLVFIGTDAPILDVSHYQLTLDALKQNDIVLNHADDGGVVIMANN